MAVRWTLRGLVTAAILAALPAHGAEPCADEPRFPDLACRLAAMAEAAGTGTLRLASRLAAVGDALRRADAVCSAGDTPGARRRLLALGERVVAVGRVLTREHGLPAGITADLDLFDALRRAAASRLARHPCPELVEVLRPADGEVVTGGDVFVLLRLAAAADPATLAADIDGASVVFAAGSVSDTQAWAHVACSAAGRHTLTVRVSPRGGGPGDAQSVTVACGASGFALGAEVEALVLRDYAPQVLRIVPVRPLRSGAFYAVVATRGLKIHEGHSFVASADFRAAGDLRTGRTEGPTAHYTAAADDPQNPFPSERLVQSDGTIRIPDGFTARALPAVPRLDGVRAFLRGLDARSEEHRGFSPNTPIVLQFDAPVDLKSARPPNLFVVEVVNPRPAGTNLPALLAALESGGIPRRSVVVASVFPVENIAGTLARIREQLIARAAVAPPRADYTNPDPTGDRPFGIFRPGEPGFFGGPTVGAFVRGRFPSPDYRVNGRFPDSFLEGLEAPPLVPIEFLLAVPAPDPGRGIVPPFPTVILQHGFCGDDSIVMQQEGELTARGLAAIGIPAPEHGTRGNCLNFFNFDDFNAFGNNWRQAAVDLLQLVRFIEAGVDLDGDGTPELRPSGLGFFGLSMGGVTGGVFTPVEPLVTAAVLNVPGGRLAQLAGATSPFAEAFLGRFATEAGIPVRTCSGDPTGPACSADADCAGAPCVRNRDFTLLLDAGTPDWQTQLDPGDGAAYARWLRIEPRGFAPRPVLVQEGIGDMIVANPLTEALARAIALPANRADHAAGGVAGLWRFPPPEGHNIIGLDTVRAQAFGFIASGGTILAAP